MLLYLTLLLPLLGGAVLPFFRFNTVKARCFPPNRAYGRKTAITLCILSA